MKEHEIFPFLWLKGESTEKIIEEIGKIYESGLRSFCVEARGDVEYLTPIWWKRMDALLLEAKRLDMQVWFFDDIHFPTGYANGEIAKNPKYRSRRIKAHCVDVVGESKKAKVFYNKIPEHEEIVHYVFMAKRDENGVDYASAIDVTQQYYHGTLYIDIPEGSYRIIFVVETTAHPERGEFIDMLNPDSTQLLVDSTYEVYYKKYKEYFGNTLVGFFSDEPRFANGMYFPLGLHSYQYGIGIHGIAYPWNNRVHSFLKRKYDGKSILALWFDVGERTGEIRVDYMELISQEYSTNFTKKLGDWCADHGVMYCGHIIEDMNSHTKTGCSAGHYFKCMEGQDISGVDVVLHQIKPFETEFPHFAPICGGYADPTFFNYTMAKLASSDARLDPYKKDRALCEVFGAYGWGETIKEMVYIIDHMMVRGINRFIPHAFSMKDRDDDCPPHFYAGGTNPSYKSFCKVMEYTNRLLDFFKDGRAAINVGVLYHAETEWTGVKYMPCDDVCKALAQAQVDYDIIPYYALKNGNVINGITYDAIIIPYAEKYPKIIEDTLKALNNCQIYYVKDENGADISEIVAEVKEKYSPSIIVNKAKDVRIMAYEKDLEKSYFLFNEGATSVQLLLDISNDYAAVDPLSLQGKELLECNGKRCLQLKKGERVILSRSLKAPIICDIEEKKVINCFNVSLCAFNESNYTEYKYINYDFDINAASEMPNFSGYIKYEADIPMQKGEILQVKYEGDSCQLNIDGNSIFTITGEAISMPVAEAGNKHVEIILNNTLAYYYRDGQTCDKQVEATYLEKVVVGSFIKK